MGGPEFQLVNPCLLGIDFAPSIRDTWAVHPLSMNNSAPQIPLLRLDGPPQHGGRA